MCKHFRLLANRGYNFVRNWHKKGFNACPFWTASGKLGSSFDGIAILRGSLEQCLTGEWGRLWVDGVLCLLAIHRHRIHTVYWWLQVASKEKTSRPLGGGAPEVARRNLGTITSGGTKIDSRTKDTETVPRWPSLAACSWWGRMWNELLG